MGRQILSFRDHGGEQAAMSVHVADLTAGNFAAQETLMNDLQTAVAAVTSGLLFKDARLAVETIFAGPLPADPNSQRETKWLVRATDSVNGRPVTFTIPTALLTNLVANQGIMDLAGPNGAALLAAIEAAVLSIDGNAITVQEIRHVGRNI